MKDYESIVREVLSSLETHPEDWIASSPIQVKRKDEAFSILSRNSILLPDRSFIPAKELNKDQKRRLCKSLDDWLKHKEMTPNILGNHSDSVIIKKLSECLLQVESWTNLTHPSGLRLKKNNSSFGWEIAAPRSVYLGYMNAWGLRSSIKKINKRYLVEVEKQRKKNLIRASIILDDLKRMRVDWFIQKGIARHKFYAWAVYLTKPLVVESSQAFSEDNCGADFVRTYYDSKNEYLENSPVDFDNLRYQKKERQRNFIIKAIESGNWKVNNPGENRIFVESYKHSSGIIIDNDMNILRPFGVEGLSYWDKIKHYKSFSDIRLLCRYFEDSESDSDSYVDLE